MESPELSWSFVISSLDPTQGPTALYSTADLSPEAAAQIAFKAFVIAGAQSADSWANHSIESIVSLPSIGKSMFVLLFSVHNPTRRKGAYPVSISFVTQVEAQIEVYRVSEIIATHFRGMAANFDYFFDSVTEEVDEEAVGTLLSTVEREIRTVIQDHMVETEGGESFGSIDCSHLFASVEHNLDTAITEILVGRPVAVVGRDKQEVRKILFALTLFSPHRRVNARTWLENIRDTTDLPDLFGTSPENTDDLVERKVCRINLARRRVYGGRSNRFSQELLRELMSVDTTTALQHILADRILWLLKNATHFSELTVTQKGLYELKKWGEILDNDLLFVLQKISERFSLHGEDDTHTGQVYYRFATSEGPPDY